MRFKENIAQKTLNNTKNPIIKNKSVRIMIQNNSYSLIFLLLLLLTFIY